MPKKTFFNLPDEKQKRILEAAKKVFSKKHYKEVTIDAIVGQANIPKGSFYQYFSNKDDLFKYIFSDLGLDKKNILMDEVKRSKPMQFSHLVRKMMERAAIFENKDEVTRGLKERFLSEVSQDVKNEILSQMIPDTIKLYEELIQMYIRTNMFRKETDVKTAAFILTTVTMNIDKYPLEKEEDCQDILLRVCRLLETGLNS